jgi:hypothetical protein
MSYSFFFRALCRLAALRRFDPFPVFREARIFVIGRPLFTMAWPIFFALACCPSRRQSHCSQNSASAVEAQVCFARAFSDRLRCRLPLGVQRPL